MGLRTASMRRPYAEVMAPALTDPAQTQSFKPPSKPKYLSDVDTVTPECCGDSNQALNCDIMSESPTLNDQNMGVHKTNQQNDVDQILNLTLNTPPEDVDLTQNVDELMQVMKSIPDEDITIEKFLTDVDMLNVSTEDQPDSKETQTKETISELKMTQNRIEERLDFLKIKIRKLQARTMGHHVSGEVAGVYEYVHGSFKRVTDNSLQIEDNKPILKPLSCGSSKAMLKKLEMAANLQAYSLARQKQSPKYFGSGSCDQGNYQISVPGIINVPPWPIEHKQELQKVTGLLHTELELVQDDIDAEATESSSGGESCDEMQSYNNPHQQYLSIQKRALWKFASQRAAIASRWTWLQAQINYLEYRIRQYSDIRRQIRTSKGEVQLGGSNPPPIPTIVNNNSSSTSAVNGYCGQLPGSLPTSSKNAENDSITTIANGAHLDYQCTRTRPLINFKKRKLLQLNGLHIISKKAAKPSTVRCGCVRLTAPCAVCTGRTDSTHPRDPTDALSETERIALVDAAFHPVFSMPEDVSHAIHCEAIMKKPEWQQRSTRMKSLKVLKSDRSDESILERRSKKIDHRKVYKRLLKPSTMSALSAKVRNKMRGRKSGRHSSSSSFRKKSNMPESHVQSFVVGDAANDEAESFGNDSNAGASNSAAVSPSSSSLLQMQAVSGYNRRNRTNSYDIDNIVIPCSVAAATRVEKIQYKEILTPKWRIADIEFKSDSKNNARNPSQDSDTEDLSEEAVVSRHDKFEFEEKKKFLSYLKLPTGHGRSRAHKRTDSLAESSGVNTLYQLSPYPVDHTESTNSPLPSPPATPLPDGLPTANVLQKRRRTISQSKLTVPREENKSPENIEINPFDSRTFPLDNDTYEKMLKNMPENHQLKTNYRAQDSGNLVGGYLEHKVDSPESESSESEVGEDDPNDPEWLDMVSSRDRRKR